MQTNSDIHIIKSHMIKIILILIILDVILQLKTT